MSSEATVSIGVVYPDADSVGVVADLLKPHPDVVRASYSAESAGVVLIEDGSTATDTFSIDFGDVAKATLLFLRNASSQELDVTFDGSHVAFTLPPGGMFAAAMSEAPSGTEISAVTLVCTASQTGDEPVYFRVFGEVAA